MQPSWRVGSHAQHDARALRWLMRALQEKPPAANVPAICLVLSSRFPAERFEISANRELGRSSLVFPP
jgi:hypothetical protein